MAQQQHPADWTVQCAYRIRGHILTPIGPQFNISGHRGRYRFIAYIKKADGSEWIDVMDPKGRLRSFRPDRISTIYTTKRKNPR
jgi:hypothetical protein